MNTPETGRLRFREMDDGDLDNIAAMLGDPAVMAFYPSPKTRAEAQDWIDWNKRNYVEHGYGLWLVETTNGEFVGDCGLTWQEVNGTPALEVGYHIRADLQGQGYASEAAAACLKFARGLGESRLVAIIDPANIASQRVAEKIGLSFELTASDGGRPRSVFGADISLYEKGLRQTAKPHSWKRHVRMFSSCVSLLQFLGPVPPDSGRFPPAYHLRVAA